VPVYVNTFFENRVRELFDLPHLIDKVFSEAGIDYRVAAGLATFLYVEEAAPDAGRTTTDVDILVRRGELERIEAAMAPYGWKYRQTAGEDMLFQADRPSSRRAVHMLFTGERVKDDSPEPTPELGKSRTLNGVRLIPLERLLLMKLTSFRLKDQTHIKDLQEAGLIKPEIEQTVPAALQDRLPHVLRTA
jgi:hypothetical protein